MKAKPIFPFRRAKKRARSGNRKQREGARRLPQNAAELLALMQPATKALAQVLAGHAKASGQIVHARNVLAQAERLVAEGAVERLAPAHREEFFEQLARLKLTVGDAEGVLEETRAEETVDEESAGEPERPPVSPEKLREVARSLAASTATRSTNGSGDPHPERAQAPQPPDNPSQAKPHPSPVHTGARRERLRLAIPGTAAGSSLDEQG